MVCQVSGPAVAGLLLLLVSGCQPQATVQGTVRLDGTPLADATVTFQPTKGSGRTVADVTDRQGRYQLEEVEIGESLVRIETYSFRVGPDGQAIEVPEILPPRYHAASELTRDVRAGQQTIDFDLESGHPR
jgi:hypothetical protein